MLSFSRIMLDHMLPVLLELPWYRKCSVAALACTFSRSLTNRNLINGYQATDSSFFASHYYRWTEASCWSCTYLCYPISILWIYDSISKHLIAVIAIGGRCSRYWFFRIYASKFLENLINCHFEYYIFFREITLCYLHFFLT